MEFRQLRFAVTLAQTLSFRRAAEIEHITQSTFSERIARLEREVGARLFERDSHGVRMTPAGERFVERAERLLAEIDVTASEARQIHAGAVGALRVGVFAEGLGEMTPVVISAFRSASPDVAVTFVELSIATQVTAVAEGTVDVAIVRPPLQDPRVLSQELFREPRSAAVGAGHPLAAAESISVTELLDDPVVDTVGPARWGSFWSCDALRDGPGRSVATTSSVAESLASVAHLGAVDTLPASAARHYRYPGVHYVPLHDATFASVAIAWRQDDRRALVQAFRETAATASARWVGMVPGAVAPDLGPLGSEG